MTIKSPLVQSASSWQAEDRGCQQITIHVCSMKGDADGGSGLVRLPPHFSVYIGRYRGIICLGDRDADSGGIGVRRSICAAKGECVRAVLVGMCCVADRRTIIGADVGCLVNRGKSTIVRRLYNGERQVVAVQITTD